MENGLLPKHVLLFSSFHAIFFVFIFEVFCFVEKFFGFHNAFWK